tara:strand:+ start:30 stop:305 length:276 start_codon:yes stop_codon:yes gene_type:complete
MKKLLILSIGLLLLASCEKEECAVCTVVRTHSVDGESTEMHSQKTDDLCEESLEDYKEDIDLSALYEDLAQELIGIMDDVTVTHTISCVNE